MSQRVITLKTDLSKMLEVVSLPGVLAGDDRAANVIRVEVYDGSEPHELTGNITGTILLPNDTTFVVDGISNWHTAQIQLPQEAYVLPGRLSFCVSHPLVSSEPLSRKTTRVLSKSCCGLTSSRPVCTSCRAVAI